MTQAVKLRVKTGLMTHGLRSGMMCGSGFGDSMLALVLFAISILLVLANGFFVAAEFAIVKARPTRLEQLVREGSSRAKLALRITRQLDAYLSANQLGITLASLALGWIGEPAVADLLRPLLVRMEIT